jgi:hypothetical protein
MVSEKKIFKTDYALFDTFGPLVTFEYFWSIKQKNILEAHQMTIPSKLCSNWSSGFRKEDSKLTTSFLTPLYLLFLLYFRSTKQKKIYG